MSIPSLADALAGTPIAKGTKPNGRVHTMDDKPPRPIASGIRVHRIAKPEEDHELPPQIFKPVTPIQHAARASHSATAAEVQRFADAAAKVITPTQPPEGGPMPRGHYERKPKADAGAPDLTKPLREKAAKKRNGAKHRALPAKVGDASFVIDDRGRMRIKDGQQEISLERADVQRLTVFLDRTKTIRA